MAVIPANMELPPKTDIQMDFEEEMELEFPGQFDFTRTAIPTLPYQSEITRYAYAGYRVGHLRAQASQNAKLAEDLDEVARDLWNEGKSQHLARRVEKIGHELSLYIVE